jgi:hypothetical protein
MLVVKYFNHNLLNIKKEKGSKPFGGKFGANLAIFQRIAYYQD